MTSLLSRAPHRRQAGFTLVEALVALLVMAFGMLAVAGFQTTMSRNSDVAKQRSEAVRLAQLKMEELRAFQQVASDGKTAADAGNIFDYTLDVVSGNDTVQPTGGSAYATNTTYTRNWLLTKNDGVTAAVGTDLEKWIRVLVTWTDRTGEVQTVTLRSIISNSDPIALGTQFPGLPPVPGLRSPKNRSIDIPYPAMSLPGGKSYIKPPGATDNYVFDDLTGNVLGYCNDTAIATSLSSNTTVSFGDSLTAGCTTQAAYLLSGYVRFLDSLPSGNEKNVDTGISNPSANITKNLSANIAFTDAAPAPQCFTERQKVLSVGQITSRDVSSAVRSGGQVTITTSGNHGFDVGQPVSVNNIASGGFNGLFTIASKTNNSFSYAQAGPNASASGSGQASLIQEITVPETQADGVTPFVAPAGYTAVVSRFVAYTCVVQPFVDGSNKWSGQLYFTPQPTGGTAWSIATGGSKVCRFTGDYKSDNLVANNEHPRTYRAVSGALDHQNYLVLPAGLGCPVDDEAAPLSDDYVNTHTILHQTTAAGAAPFGGLPSTGQWGGSGETGSETAFPMF